MTKDELITLICLGAAIEESDNEFYSFSTSTILVLTPEEVREVNNAIDRYYPNSCCTSQNTPMFMRVFLQR